jgi:hypothetical protein
MLYPNGTTTEPASTDQFGPRKPVHTPNGTTGKFHYGADYVDVGPVHAIDAGVVEAAGAVAGWEAHGLMVLIRHSWGWSRYSHLDAVNVRVGDQGAEGQVLGPEGDSGAALGRHLHLQVHVGGASNAHAIDPRPFLRNHLARPATQTANTNPGGIETMLIAKVNHGNIRGNFLIIPNGTGKPSALGLAGNAGFSGLPTVDINEFSEAFWKAVSLV